MWAMDVDEGIKQHDRIIGLRRTNGVTWFLGYGQFWYQNEDALIMDIVVITRSDCPRPHHSSTPTPSHSRVCDMGAMCLSKQTRKIIPEHFPC